MIFLSSPAVHTFFLTAFRKASCTRGLKIPIVNLHPVRRPATEVSAHFPYRRPCVLNTNVLVVGSERKKNGRGRRLSRMPASANFYHAMHVFVRARILLAIIDTHAGVLAKGLGADERSQRRYVLNINGKHGAPTTKRDPDCAAVLSG